MFKFFRIMLAITAAVLFVAPAFAQDATPPAIAKLTLGENKWIELHYLLQVQANTWDQWEGNVDNKENERWGKDFQVRRSRIILKGQVAENVTFFMETDDVFIGKSGKGASTAAAGTTGDGDTYTDKQGVFTQDAFINYKVSDAFQVAAGQILLPFMHTNRASAAQIFGVDYNQVAYGASIVPLGTTTNNWRDTGVEFRGLVMNGLIDYRVGAFNGVNPNIAAGTNKDDNLRYTGRVQVNLKDAEEEFFYSENYLGKKNILSFGIGVDYMKDAIINVDGDPDDYTALTADVTVDTKISGDMILTVHGAYLTVENLGTQNEISGYYVEGGVLIGKIQPLIKYASAEVKPEGGEKVESTNLTIGCNYFINGHNANIKGEFVNALGDNKDLVGAKQVNVQFQIFI